MEMLRLRHCRVLKRVPKAPRIPAVGKRAEVLRLLTSRADSVERLTVNCCCSPSHVLVFRDDVKEYDTASLAFKVYTAIATIPVAAESNEIPSVV